MQKTAIEASKSSTPQTPIWVNGGKELIRVGRIVRSHGISGEVELQFSDDAFDRGSAEYFVLEVEGIFVPFFWEEYRFKNNTTIILKLEGYDSDSSAKKLVGLSAYYPAEALPDDDKPGLTSMQALVGMTLQNQNLQDIGVITSVDDSTSNILLYITTPQDKELIIPFHDDFLLQFDYKKRTLRMDIPHGILNINE